MIMFYNACFLNLPYVPGLHTDCEPVQTFTRLIASKSFWTPDKPANFGLLILPCVCVCMCICLFIFGSSYEEDNLWWQQDGLFVLNR